MNDANAMNQAMRFLHQSGRDRSRAIYRRLLAANPNDAGTLHTCWAFYWASAETGNKASSTFAARSKFSRGFPTSISTSRSFT